MILDKFKKPANRNFFIAILILIALVVFYSLGYFSSGGNKKDGAGLNDNTNLSTKNTANESLVGSWAVDSSEDYRALGYAGQRKIVADGEGGFYLAYRKKFNGKYQIFVARGKIKEGEYIFEENQQPIAEVSGADDQRVPSMTIDSEGVLHVVWYGVDQGKNNNERQIKYSQSKDRGQTWSAWKNIAFVSGYIGQGEYWQEHPFILARDGKLWVVWEGRDSLNLKQQIKSTVSYNDGETWEAWKNVKETKPNTQSRPTLLTRDGRELHLLMYSSWGNASGLQQIQHSFSTDGGENWSEWLNISDPEKDSRHLSACLTQNGKIYTAWRSYDLATNKSQLEYSFLIGRSWRNPTPVAASANNQFFPSISCLSEGEDFYLSWMENSDASLLPREEPLSGTVFFSHFNGQGFSGAQKVNEGSDGHYPNLPETVEKNSSIPIFYGEKQTDGKNNLILKTVEK